MSRPERSGGRLLRLLEVLVVLGALLQRGPIRRPPPGVDPEDLAAGYERSDMNPVVVVAAAAGLLLTLAVVLVAITSFEAALTGTPPSVSRPADLINGLQAAPAPTPPEPRLEAQSGQTLDPYRAGQEQKLSSYGWVDRQTGVARMPIDRAMDLVAQRGLSARAASTPTARDSASSSPSVASSGRVDEAYP
jgi:hypothetical protein